mgnify:CR=1 FL=1
MKNINDHSTAINIIGKETIITGDIESASDIRIDGTLKGSVNTAGKLVVGNTGIVEGDVHCENAEIAGNLKAKITVSQTLSLKSTSKLTGDIITDKLAIEPGAAFSGSCSMGAIIKDIKDVGKTNSQQEQKSKTA